MFSFFREVIAFFGLIINLVMMLVNGLKMLLTTIPKGMVFFTQAIAYLPPLVSGFAMASIMVSVVFLIVGRQGKT